MKPTKQQIDTLFTMAKERGLSPMWTHFYRESSGTKTLAATACILLDDNHEPISRGLTLVSLKDNGVRAYGRLLSLKRAYSAAASEKAVTEEVLRPPDGYPVDGIMNYGKPLVKASRRVQGVMTSVEADRIKSKKQRIADREATAKKAAAAAKKASSRRKAAAGAVG